jgi:hypothetical protein
MCHLFKHGETYKGQIFPALKNDLAPVFSMKLPHLPLGCCILPYKGRKPVLCSLSHNHCHLGSPIPYLSMGSLSFSFSTMASLTKQMLMTPKLIIKSYELASQTKNTLIMILG